MAIEILERLRGGGVSDPVLAAVQGAPQMSSETAKLCRTLVAEAKSDPSDPAAWLTEEQLMARLGRSE